MNFTVRIVNSISEIDPEEWNLLAVNRPFQSYRWYEFGERVMADCLPIYVLLSLDDRPAARGTFWLVRNEPLPLPPWAGTLLRPLLRCWPLLICRSPLANLSGLILPESPLRETALNAIAAAAMGEARRHRASLILFDYLNRDAFSAGWPAGYIFQAIGEPGSKLEIAWPDFESYLRSLTPKTRKNYRRYCREAGRRQVRIVCHSDAVPLDRIMPLIENVEKRHKNPFNPWFRGMLEFFPMVDGTLIAAEIGDRTVGCELLLGDGGEYLVTALGLDYGEPNIYFLLNFADIRCAIERGARCLHWGSGAYEVKRRLGFQVERNNHIAFTGVGRVVGWLGRFVARM